MKLYEKIRLVRKEKSLSLRGLESRLKGIFADRALRYNTLYRIEKGLRQPRLASLTQICLGLGVTLRDLTHGTEEEKLGVVNYIRRRDIAARYTYSENAVAEFVTTEKQPFLGLRLTLKPGARTNPEQDPVELGRFEKLVYCLKGRIGCTVGQDTFSLKKDDVLCFESNIPHHFENTSEKKSVCLIIQNPRHI